MRKVRYVVAGLVLLVGISGIAWATIPDALGVIHGCYKNTNPAKGAVTVIDSESGEVCPSGTTPLNWNQTGVQGPAGPQGPAGANGTSIAARIAVDTSTTTYTQPADTLDCLYVVPVQGGNQALWYDGVQFDVIQGFSQVVMQSGLGPDACLYEAASTTHTLRASTSLVVLVVRAAP